MSKPQKPARYMRNARKRDNESALYVIAKEQSFTERVTEIANNIIKEHEAVVPTEEVVNVG